MPNNTLASTKATFSQVFLNLKHLVHVMSHTCPAAEDYIQYCTKMTHEKLL